MSFLINPFAFAVAGGDFESIATVTVGSGGATDIEFTSIPGTYQHLQIRLIMRSTTTIEPTVSFNGDTNNSNYYRHLIYGDGSSVAAGANQLRSFSGYYEVATNVVTACVLDILDYSSTTKNKTIRAQSGIDKNGSGYFTLYSGLWMNTGAITSIKYSASFAEHTSIALFGVKAP